MQIREKDHACGIAKDIDPNIYIVQKVDKNTIKKFR